MWAWGRVCRLDRWSKDPQVGARQAGESLEGQIPQGLGAAGPEKGRTASWISGSHRAQHQSQAAPALGSLRGPPRPGPQQPTKPGPVTAMDAHTGSRSVPGQTREPRPRGCL